MTFTLPRTLAGAHRDAARPSCYGPRHQTYPRAATTAARPVQMMPFSLCALRSPVSVPVVKCFGHMAGPAAGASSPPPGGESGSSNAGAEAAAAASTADLQSARTRSTAGDGRTEALQEALSAVLSEQAKQLTPLLREELKPLVEQVSKLRAELRGADACHQQQGASVPAVQQQGQQQQQQEQERQQQQEGQPTSSGGDGVSAGAGPRRVWMWPKLLEYVTPAPGSELAALAHKVFGRVVYSNQDVQQVYLPQRGPDFAWRVAYGDVHVVPRSRVPGEALMPEVLPYDPARLGVPVTPFTAAHGMLVRRGHDWKGQEGTNGENGELGVLSLMVGEGNDMWTVAWADGSKGWHCTGRHNSFELSHVAVCEGSGAPVTWAEGSLSQQLQLQRAAVAGAAVVRGAHWVLRDGGTPAEMARLRLMNTSGGDTATVQVQWDGTPEGYAQVVPMLPLPPRTTNSTLRIFPLNYVARPGEPVTVMTARQGLRVMPKLQQQQLGTSNVGKALAGADAATGAAGVTVGTLVRPKNMDKNGMWWSVDWGAGPVWKEYQVGATHLDACDLQVAP